MRVFFSYAHQDEKLAQQFMTHLTYLKYQKGIEFWYDGKIEAGDVRKPAITSMLEKADVILLFITPDFISSSECYEFEMQHALERHNAGKARVVPILVRPLVSWDNAPFAELQAVPKNGRPVTTWPNRDRGWVAVIEEIYPLLQAVTTEDMHGTGIDARKGGLSFAHIALDQQSKGWCGPEMSLQNSSFARDTQLLFHRCNTESLSDPGFDITLLNPTSRPVILTKLGIVIDAVSHPATLSMFPRASTIEIDTSYAIELPNIVAHSGPFGDEPSDLHQSFSIDLPDPIYVPSEAPYRYCLFLRNYCQHMPQEADIRLWIQTDTGKEKSSLMHLSLLS